MDCEREGENQSVLDSSAFSDLGMHCESSAVHQITCVPSEG